MSMSSDELFFDVDERSRERQFALAMHARGIYNHNQSQADRTDDESYGTRDRRNTVRSRSLGGGGRSRSESSTHRRSRYSLQQQVNVPEVPKIPPHYLVVSAGGGTSMLQTRQKGNAQSSLPLLPQHYNPSHDQSPNTSAGERESFGYTQSQSPSAIIAITDDNHSKLVARQVLHQPGTAHPGESLARIHRGSRTVSNHPRPPQARVLNLDRELLEPRTPETNSSNFPNSFTSATVMPRERLHDDHDDYFLELANEQGPATDDIASLRRSMSRASFSSKRRSLPVDAVRPSTSGGNMYSRPPSRLENLRASTGLFHHSDAPRRTSLTRTSHYDDTASAAAGRPRRFSALLDHSPVSPRQRTRSPESQSYGRRRSSFGTAPSEPRHRGSSIYLTPTLESQESPTESSDQPQTDSSVESQPADTVWDELDELKSRIKKLESGDKKPSSSAAASGDSSDRPRTATTAPTTITSSPKQPRKQDLPQPQKTTPSPPATEQNEVGSLWANVHPLLHDALGKSKDSLSSSVFHNLEAVVADALQLAALTGTLGSQSNPNVAINERQVRRRVDNLCRNMTDLAIALREPKQEASILVSSPAQIESPAADLPLRRFSRTSSLAVAAPTVGRPMSRLEQRKSSLLGPQALGTVTNISPRGSHGELSASEAESTPTHSSSLQPPRRISAVPSRAMRSRLQQTREESHADEERAQRPPSRAMTDFSSSFRVTSRLASQDRSPGAQRRTPSLRDTLATRRKYDTPPVLEEDVASPVPQPRNRVFSSGQQPQYNKVPSRTSSIIRSKHLTE
ncbi:hypothetical protein Slin15195_G003980 [Septoria linicola]|uniref:Uncharacterized protein n=1 Tax=Septoria linicola TaxID=215465 RepID=A0A9Q9AGD3_9PEZI|nr:hypothetical protein Slin14017_G004010 [Septoria linicola]USW47079.1 hypothetical protein Slin15195_G003980 [Septoria linicola]